MEQIIVVPVGTLGMAFLATCGVVLLNLLSAIILREFNSWPSRLNRLLEHNRWLAQIGLALLIFIAGTSAGALAFLFVKYASLIVI